jgi:restriction endonuclease
MDLKNKLTEEEAIQEIHKMSKYRIKSAQEKTDEYIEVWERADSKAFQHTIKLKQLIAAERADRKEG